MNDIHLYYKSKYDSVPSNSDINSRALLLTTPFTPVNTPISPTTSRENSHSEIVQMQFVQSTPTTSGNRLVSGFDIFGANPASPIQVKIEPVSNTSFEEYTAEIQNKTVDNSVNKIDQSYREMVDDFYRSIKNLKYEDY